jgi:hypothetical protein
MNEPRPLKCRWCDTTIPAVEVKGGLTFVIDTETQVRRLRGHAAAAHPAYFRRLQSALNAANRTRPTAALRERARLRWSAR